MSEIKSNTAKKRLGQRLSVKNQITLQPASDGKLKYFSGASSSRETPVLSSQQIEPKFMSAPRDLSVTSCRTKLKRRRLEFVDHTQSDDCLKEDAVSLSELTNDELTARILEKQNQLKNLMQHKRKMNEFLENIRTWEEAFKSAVDDLSEKSGQSKEDLLDALKIPFDLASLID